MTGFAIVSTTVAGEDAARELAAVLVEMKLAACVQILPVESVYCWEGAIETAREHLLICKVREVDFGAVETAIRAGHDYDVPEIVMTPILAGSSSYLAWLAASTAR